MPSIAHLIHAYGLLVVAGVVGAEGVGIPLPGETALIIASVIAGSKHELNIVAVILVAGGASVVGRMIGYAIGRNFGYWLLLRYGGYVGITETRIKLGQYLFLRHGGKIIVTSRPGHGATFVIELPMSKRSEPGGTAEGATQFEGPPL